jgi:hypothetical protein
MRKNKNIKNKIYGGGLLIGSILSIIILKDITLSVMTIPLSIYLIISKENWIG